MAGTTPNTNHNQDRDAQPIPIEVHYTSFDPDNPGFELARDIRVYATPDQVTPDAFTQVYEEIAATDLDPETHGLDPSDTQTILSNIFSRLQGGRRDPELGYDGSHTRSMMIGDIIVLDGDAYLVGPGFSFPDLGEMQHLRSDTDDSGDDVDVDGGDWDPEPASLRDGEDPDTTHARRNAEMLRRAREELDSNPSE